MVESRGCSATLTLTFAGAGGAPPASTSEIAHARADPLAAHVEIGRPVVHRGHERLESQTADNDAVADGDLDIAD